MAAMMLSVSAGAEDAKLPDPLTMQDGRRVESAAMWTAERRPELLELFRANVYGRAPAGWPQGATCKITFSQDGNAVREDVVMTFSGPGGKIDVHLYILFPLNATKPVPAFLLINHLDDENLNPETETDSPFWPARQIVERGYAAAILQAQDVDPDTDDGFKNGIHGVYDDPSEPRAGDAWGTIAAWAWGASRAMDYLERDSAIDASKVAVVGHSRGGKTALWAGAQDERFALVISNNSGCTGAALSRRPVGETVKDINDRFPHWFCANYRKFNARETELPVDQHELIALMAPRLVYVASATEDKWADPEGEFLACVEASPVYALLGAPGIEATSMPAPETPLQSGRIGYHLRTGKHDLTEYDWNQFMDFAYRYWKP